MTRSGAGAGEPPVSGARTQFAQTSENAPALALTRQGRSITEINPTLTSEPAIALRRMIWSTLFQELFNSNFSAIFAVFKNIF